jgi:hypothetical protein
VSVVARINDRQLIGHRLRRIPHPLDEVVVAVIRAYRTSTASEQVAMLDELNRVGISVLCTFPERLAAVAVRGQDVEPLQQGLIALGMVAALLEDPRDHLFALAVINHGAQVLGTDLATLIDSVIGEVPAAAVAQFRAFAARAEGDKSLAAFGRRTHGDGTEFRYS